MDGGAVRLLRGWSTGCADPGTRGSVLVCAGPVDPGWAAPARWDVVLAPWRHAPLGGAGSVWAYEGSFTGSDSPIRCAGGLAWRHLAYGSAGLLGGDGLRVLRVGDEADFSAYLRDADIAWRRGVFPDFMTDPAVTLADSSALGWEGPVLGPSRRAFAWPDGSISTSPSGTILGGIGSGLQRLERVWRALCGPGGRDVVSLGLVVAERDRRDALAERPWLGRYLTVTEAFRIVRSRGLVPLRADGFGAGNGEATLRGPVDVVTASGTVRVPVDAIRSGVAWPDGSFVPAAAGPAAGWLASAASDSTQDATVHRIGRRRPAGAPRRTPVPTAANDEPRR